MTGQEPLAVVTAALEECRALIPEEQARAVLEALQGAFVPPPPGDDRERLPDDVLAVALPGLRPYLSTACEVALVLDSAAHGLHRHRREELLGWADRMHRRCRVAHAFTMRRCACAHHEAVEEA